MVCSLRAVVHIMQYSWVVKRTLQTLVHIQHIETHPNLQNALFKKFIILMVRGDDLKSRKKKSECFERILNNSSFVCGHSLTLQGRSITRISRTIFHRFFLKCYYIFSHNAIEQISALAGRKWQEQ